jgi:hypothetical protein
MKNLWFALYYGGETTTGSAAERNFQTPLSAILKFAVNVQ